MMYFNISLEKSKGLICLLGHSWYVCVPGEIFRNIDS